MSQRSYQSGWFSSLINDIEWHKKPVFILSEIKTFGSIYRVSICNAKFDFLQVSHFAVTTFNLLQDNVQIASIAVIKSITILIFKRRNNF